VAFKSKFKEGIVAALSSDSLSIARDDVTITSITFGSIIVDWYVANVVEAPAALALAGTAFAGVASAPAVTMPTATIVTADGQSMIIAEVTLMLSSSDVVALTSKDPSDSLRRVFEANFERDVYRSAAKLR
jgi:hypothetical protein